jgi:hypothetical protein
MSNTEWISDGIHRPRRSAEPNPHYIAQQLVHALRIALRGDVEGAEMMTRRIQRATAKGQRSGALVTDAFRNDIAELLESVPVRVLRGDV